jgi:hypothetical protein
MAEIIICDTNIIIEVFKRNLQTISLIERIGTDNLAISSITIMELYFGALNILLTYNIKDFKFIKPLRLYAI